MSRFKIVLTAVILTAFTAVSAFADRPGDRDRRDRRDIDKRDRIVRTEKVEKRMAQSILKRTTQVLVTAQRAVKNQKNYTGNLFKAYQHQKYARYLFANGDYDRAVNQSLRAREFAYQSMKDNRYRHRQDYDRDEMRIRDNIKNDEIDRDEQKYWEKNKDNIIDDRRTPDRIRDRDRDNKSSYRAPVKDDDIVKINIQAEFGD